LHPRDSAPSASMSYERGHFSDAARDISYSLDMVSKPYPEDDFQRRIVLVNESFSPSTPITTKSLFSGRSNQMTRLLDIITQRGQHGLVYGDRGVGKTSLAKVMHEVAQNSARICAYFTCSSNDTFDTIWPRTFEEIRWVVESQPPGFSAEAVKSVENARGLLPESPSPDDIRRALDTLSRAAPLVIFVDEFDRPVDDQTRTLFADTVKILSDNGTDATLVLIGVASAVADLIEEHLSIGRALIQVQMPPMSPNELEAIVRSGMEAAEMTVDDGFVNGVVRISQGLPHYAHLIGQHGARYAVMEGGSHVETADIGPAVRAALEDAMQTARETFVKATSSGRETIYKEVLIACAMAKKDELGQFGSSDLREPLRMLTGKDYQIPAYSAHLNDFSGAGLRGGILTREGTQRFRFRFIDPLLPPYVLMKGFELGLIKSPDQVAGG
jgi:Cdc6-like AAA superfamily ATPase